MGEVRTHRDLDVWKEGIELVVKIYEIVQNFPKEEKYGLVDQIKRSAISIPSNIAEGAARNSKREFLQFLHISLGSISELETQFIIANRLGFLNNDEIFSLIEKERSKILGLIKYLRGEKKCQKPVTSHVLHFTSCVTTSHVSHLTSPASCITMVGWGRLLPRWWESPEACASRLAWGTFTIDR